MRKHGGKEMRFFLIEDIEEEKDDFATAEQEYSSANTSINSAKLPAIFRLVEFNPNTINLDYGGGKFDNATEYLEKNNVKNYIYDRFNRTPSWNREAVKAVRKAGGADTATLSNVLNVIKEDGSREEVLYNIKELLKPNGTLYVTVYEGDKSGEGKVTSAGYQLNRKTADYMEEISKVFPNVTRHGKVIVAKP